MSHMYTDATRVVLYLIKAHLWVNLLRLDLSHVIYSRRTILPCVHFYVS